MRAFEEVYLKLLNKVTYFAYQYLNDITRSKCVAHDVFLTLWENRSAIDPQGNLQSYILTITRNKCINILRHSQVESRHHSNESRGVQVFNLEALSDISSEVLLRNEVISQLGRVLKMMPEKTKEAFVMSRFNRKSYEEIAKIHGVTVKNVEYRIMQALKILRREFADYLPAILGLFVASLYSICRIVL
ncbi:MAG: RNA polymerase sigma-70 factor [Bacteroidales bacterium]|nr:RNA polymerase sigma-70 factor [Bacteroidales bacterium]